MRERTIAEWLWAWFGIRMRNIHGIRGTIRHIDENDTTSCCGYALQVTVDHTLIEIPCTSFATQVTDTVFPHDFFALDKVPLTGCAFGDSFHLRLEYPEDRLEIQEWVRRKIADIQHERDYLNKPLHPLRRDVVRNIIACAKDTGDWGLLSSVFTEYNDKCDMQEDLAEMLVFVCERCPLSDIMQFHADWFTERQVLGIARRLQNDKATYMSDMLSWIATLESVDDID